ncbi:Mediator of RNA polymerase II transcription subunit 6 [Ceratocystis fimbriata CBS 114723]|uniref:Mediator of RNA polymerase II transcription subunit 6 n=1 Tax=Ceratocystis fimbriata CBS 114723 TaxID=1035309 RepID=A0A2C5WYS5_9PEZI|nr:Mediator of RNA polymerase II transcription subunit 6 [Ceratocystis fimbriata CBS 114723]
MPAQEPKLDEIQWRSPMAIADLNGIHSNTILYYFAQSPFFNATSNNAVLFSQAMHNQNMFPLIQTREAFEGHLRTMSGLEFMVVEEPAEMGPGMGTGVWIINKQMRKKQPGEEDEVTVLATYFVVGENIYQAPMLADIINARVATIASSMRSIITQAESIRSWKPSQGHTYISPLVKKETADLASSTPGNSQVSQSQQATNVGPDASEERALQRLAEESMKVHVRYGGDYIDENPITGEPGKFHLSSTGRSAAAAAAASSTANASVPSLASVGSLKAAKKDDKKDAPGSSKERKGSQKPRRRKSKSIATTPAAA